MIFEKFIDASTIWWTNYLNHVQDQQKKGNLDSGNRDILYPTLILFTKFPDQYVMELIGATKAFNGLVKKIHKEQSIHRYFNQFTERHEKPAFLIGLTGGLRHMTFARSQDYEKVQDRFPQMKLFPSMTVSTFEPDCVFHVKDDLEAFAFENCLFINNHENLFRCKNILSAYVFKKRTTHNEVVSFYESRCSSNQIKGIHTVSATDSGTMISSQLQNLYLSPKTHETTIGEFIRQHPEIIHKAFDTENFIYEPYLEWVERIENCTDQAINPDLIVQRKDGHWDIYDLKTALLEKKTITSPTTKRRALISCVEEGLSQLAHYRDYFDYPANAKLALEKYGITINRPKLVLVIGSWDNYKTEEVREACRKHDKDIEIIDYDTMCSIFRSKSA